MGRFSIIYASAVKPMTQFRHGYNQIVYLTGVALILITVGIEFFQYHRHQQLILRDLKNRLEEHASNMDLRAQTIQRYVNGFKMVAENTLFYIKEFGLPS